VCDQVDEPVEQGEMWPISKILAEVKESCDVGYLDTPGDWFHMMSRKASDPNFGRLLQAIPDQGFLDPIGIYWSYDHWTLGNGHHRLTAAILLGLDEIPVIDAFRPPSGETHERELSDIPADYDTCDFVANSLENDEYQERNLMQERRLESV